MAPTVGVVFTVTTAVVVAVPQLFVFENVMVVVPVLIPVTTPVLPTLATEVLLLAQVPPVVVSVSVMAEPTHTVAGPLMIPAVGAGSTVTLCTEVSVPQPNTAVKVILVVPAVTPVTTPVEEFTDAIAVDPDVQVPPEVESERVIELPTHTVEGPDMVTGVVAPTDTGAVINVVPQPLVSA